MKTQAAVLWEPGQPVEVLEVDLAPPQRNEVLVRIAACGVCYSDLHVVDGHLPEPLPLVLGEGLLLAVPGILAGVAGAALAARMISSVIVTVDASDVSTYAAVAALQATAANAACLWPAHRATKADPILALRAE